MNYLSAWNVYIRKQNKFDTIQMYFLRVLESKLEVSYICYELLYYDSGKSRKTYNAALRFA